MKITLAQLKAKNACSDQVTEFERRFGESVEISEAACLAVADAFDWDWAARNLLSAPLDAEYERQRAPLYAEYGRHCARLDAEYGRHCAPLDAEYKRQRAQLFGRLAS